VPGPLVAKLTDKWLLYLKLSGKKAQAIDKLHKKYGPVVQIAPNQISFSSIDCINSIYGVGSTCRKSDDYESLGGLGVFRMQDPEEHRQRRKKVRKLGIASSAT
jgi:hypothetical protein